MKVAIVGSRGLRVEDFSEYLPDGVTEIVSGGANGIDKCAAAYANAKGMKLTVFLPEYSRYGRCAPLRRNDQIVDYADMVIAFWDGISHGTKYVIEAAKRRKMPLCIKTVND